MLTTIIISAGHEGAVSAVAGASAGSPEQSAAAELGPNMEWARNDHTTGEAPVGVDVMTTGRNTPKSSGKTCPRSCDEAYGVVYRLPDVRFDFQTALQQQVLSGTIVPRTYDLFLILFSQLTFSPSWRLQGRHTAPNQPK